MAHDAAGRTAITLAYRRDEAQCVGALVSELQAACLPQAPVADRARALVTAVRLQRRGASGVDHLMHEFSLSSHEGVALMCLAEALLRIPDALTADRLIRDKICNGDWRAHLGHSGSLFVNAATWGLMITGKLVATNSETNLGNALTRLIAKGGEPLIRKGVEFAMELLGRQFVMGETIVSALDRSQAKESSGYTHSFDMLGEAALTSADAERYYRAYEQAIHAIGTASAGRGVYGGPGISVKLSALHPRYARSQQRRVLDELLPRLKSLAQIARRYDIGLNIDAEEADRLELSLELLQALAFDCDLSGWDGLGFAVQTYQKRSPFVVDHLIALARNGRRRIMLRLVKGAYWDSEIKRTQVDGLEAYPVFTRKVHSDLAYLVCAKRLLAAPDAIYAQFATHNALTLASVVQLALDRSVDDYEFQCLHGMGEALYDNVVGVVGAGNPGRRCRIYAPVGSHETLLPYLVRRLLENGANNSFVNRIVDDAVGIDELLIAPLDQVLREGGGPHPGIPLPQNLYGSVRRNSAGLDLSNEMVLATLERELQALKSRTWEAVPLLGDREIRPGTAREVSNPARGAERVGTVCEAGVGDADTAVGIAAGFAREWSEVDCSQRAAMLERAADVFERHRTELISLCVREAGKTWGNAVAEIREAVDFCRYYAQQMRAISGAAPDSMPPGPVVCISPWNFPLAIFVGQVSAALAAGSPVVAKPAEQTPLIAAYAVKLLHQAGVPRAALQFLPGRGETVGAALTADSRVRGVLFTGSLEVAQLINQTLAGRAAAGPETRLIAETGGQNAMIADSSALLEQVVQDVIVSGFDSAGQRCSALRVLCVQNDIADRLLGMLKAAMQELRVGDPGELSTDVGPVIDAEARLRLERHIESMRAAGKRVFQLPLPERCWSGTFVAPTLIEIDSLSELKYEVFGPVVHILRFDGDQLDQVIDAINDTGYGLTFGLHSRIDETIEHAVGRVRAGNLYINRNMVGAVVGVQPFGGEGKSGTGPKAGGPLYLHRLRGTENVAPQALGGERSSEKEDSVRALAALAAWAREQGLRELAASCAYYSGISFIQQEIALPGPTGEINTLRFMPRGKVLCLAPAEDALLEQIAAVVATDNEALLEAGQRNLLAKLPPNLDGKVQLHDNNYEQLAAILFQGSREARAELQTRMAARDGALLPVISPAADSGRYPLYRLIAERVVSVNTTAAGGNTTLMTLGA